MPSAHVNRERAFPRSIIAHRCHSWRSLLHQKEHSEDRSCSLSNLIKLQKSTVILQDPEISSVQFSSVQSLSCVQFFVTPSTATHQASLSITNSWSLLKLMSIESVMPSNDLILCCPLLFLPSIFPSTRVFSNELALHIRWPKDWSFTSSSVLPMNTQD